MTQPFDPSCDMEEIARRRRQYSHDLNDCPAHREAMKRIDDAEAKATAAWDAAYKAARARGLDHDAACAAADDETGQ